MSAAVSTFGFPLMHLEDGERRCFLPGLMRTLERAGAAEIVIEDRYGEAMGVPTADYLAASPKVRTGTWAECLSQDAVVQVRCPPDDVLRKIPRGSVLVAMLHYPTRPGRVAFLSELGLVCVSLDSVSDDSGRRMVENLQGVGWYGARAAFRELQGRNRRFHSPARGPLRATILGAGGVAGHAMLACTRYGDRTLHRQLVAHNVLGVEVTVVDYDTTCNENYMLSRLEQTDLLVDATARRDPSRPVVPNDWVEALPQASVILDLAADPYDFTLERPHVKGVEGVPQGNLDQYVFTPDDPAYDAIDPRVDTTFRRTSLSCYSWPGVEPLDCMRIYSEQIVPILELLLYKDVADWDDQTGRVVERSVARAELTRWRRRHAR